MKTKATLQKSSHRTITAGQRTSVPFFNKSPRPGSQAFFNISVQARLKKGKPGDKFERQADAIADKVADGRSSANDPVYSEITPITRLKQDEKEGPDKGEIQKQSEDESDGPADSESEQEEDIGPVQKKEEEEEELASEEYPGQEARAMKYEEVQTHPLDGKVVHARESNTVTGSAAGAVESKLRSSKGKGGPLPDNIRRKMEHSFAADFSGIRIHTDHAAVLLSKTLNAQALTHGRDIYFNRNRFSPYTRQGRHLLAHELTHAVQQGAAGPGVLQLDHDSRQVSGEIQKKEEDSESYMIRPELLAAVRKARGEIGKVNAQKANSDGTRMGWEELYDYFFTAFGKKEVIHKDIIKELPRNIKKDILPSWCGIFVWWAYKSAGIPIPDWKLGISIFGKVKPRGPGELPRKGDIAYRNQCQHFAMVSGVESPESSAGKFFKSVKVATINGNTSGDNNLGGQIEEKWHPIRRWDGFFDPLANLSMPDAPLVKTGYEPDLADAGEEKIPVKAEEQKEQEPDPAQPVPLSEDDVPGAEQEIAPSVETDVGVELPEPPAPVEMERTAEIAPLEMKGSSNEYIVEFTEASPSQLAGAYPLLGKTVSKKTGQERKDEAADAPVLTAKTSGKTDEGLTRPDQIPVPAVSIEHGITEEEPARLEPGPHENFSEMPDNKDIEKQLDKQGDEEFADWLRNRQNKQNLMSRIQTRDPGLNTSAGERQKVKLEGEANPNRMTSQGQEAQKQVRAQRDATTEKLKNHPGQGNIQPRKINEQMPVRIPAEESFAFETKEDQGMADYVNAPLPENIRKKADNLLKPGTGANLKETRTKTRDTARQKEKDKKTEIEKAGAETAKLNEKADADQRSIVVENRRKVADKQKQGIEQAFSKAGEFTKRAEAEQINTKKQIGDKVRDSEDKARTELEKGEKDAEAKKKEGENKAAEKKREFDREQKRESWWDKVASAIKRAVKAITSAIDAIFTMIRDAVKIIIEKAKNFAVGIINGARDWIVGQLNKFRDLAKEMANKYLAEKFPGIAKDINEGIDGVADAAIKRVNFVAAKVVAGVEKLAIFLAGALGKMLSVFQTALKAAVEIAGAALTGDFKEALKIVIQAGCDIAGIDSKPIFDFFERAGNQITKILKEPGVFFNNLMKAVGGGVRNFAKNIKQHLIKGLIGWLTGALSNVAITLPEKFDVKGIFSLVMQILGLTWQNIRAKVIKRYPPSEKVFSAIEKGMAIVGRLGTEGPVALWGEVKKSLSNLREMVVSAIRNFVIITVAKEAITWLLGLLTPTGAIVKLLKILFDFIMFLIERFSQIKDFVMSVYNSIAAIASGQTGKASKKVENSMALSLPVVISLLASLAGLGGIGKTVKNIISKVSKPVTKIVDKVVDKIVKFAKKLLKKGKSKAKEFKGKVVGWWKARKRFTAKNGEPHTLFFKGRGKNAILMMRSEEMTYQKFLDEIKKDTLADKKGYDFAYKIAKKIDNLKGAPKNKNISTEKADAQRKKESKELLKELAFATEGLFVEKLPEFEGLEGEKLEYGGLNTKGFGKMMHVKILTREGGGIGKGSDPKDEGPHWETLNKRRDARGKRVYIRGHLLNNNLGGPGVWKNMTPLSYSGNTKHEADVESYVKTAVMSGAVMDYYVHPEYPSGGRSDKTDIINEIEKKNMNDAKEKIKIIELEDYVPYSLKCIAHMLKKKGNEYETVKTKALPVKNPIKRKAEEYNLKQSKDNEKKIDPVNINLITEASTLTTLVSELKAKKISEPKGKLHKLKYLSAAAGDICETVKSRRLKKGPIRYTKFKTLAKELVKARALKKKNWKEGRFEYNIKMWEKRFSTWEKRGFITLKKS